MHSNISLLLDTHIFLWLMNGSKELKESSKITIIKATNEGRIGISAISIWEIGMLHARQRIYLSQPPLEWINQSLKAPGIVLCPLTPQISIESTILPGKFHGDPADRIIVATSRILSIPLMTCDEKIISYGQEGYAQVLLV